MQSMIGGGRNFNDSRGASLVSNADSSRGRK